MRASTHTHTYTHTCLPWLEVQWKGGVRFCAQCHEAGLPKCWAFYDMGPCVPSSVQPSTVIARDVRKKKLRLGESVQFAERPGSLPP